MKKSIILLLFAIGIIFVGCNPVNLNETVDKPETYTTVEIQNLPKDTFIMGHNPKTNQYYVFDEKQELVEGILIADGDELVQVHFMFLILMILTVISLFAIFLSQD